MIPKLIHYCWFGKGPLPKMAVRCIESWRRFLPDFEIIEWNEDNFDVNIIPYTRDAYLDGKYAFVSDYARFWILYHFGGVYFDTDVELIRSLDDILARGPFMGLEMTSPAVMINPGLGLAIDSGDSTYKKILNGFEMLNYYLPNGSRNLYTMIPMVTDIMIKEGLCEGVNVQKVASIYVYAPEYFNPFDDATGRLIKTENTRTIHWFMKSWMPGEKGLKLWVKRRIRRLFGQVGISVIKSIFSVNR